MSNEESPVETFNTNFIEKAEINFQDMTRRIHQKMNELLFEFYSESGQKRKSKLYLKDFMAFLDRKEDEIKRIYEESKVQNTSIQNDDDVSSNFIALNSILAEYGFIRYLAPGIFRVDPNASKVKGKFKRPGHLSDQMLKYNPNKINSQNSIFDTLEESTKQDILDIVGVEVTEIVEGIRLSPSEVKIIDCLCKLLHERSQTSEPDKDSYYSGNMTHELVKYGEDNSTPAPKLSFTLYELTKEYNGGKYVSGKDIDNVKVILQELDTKRFLLSYIETTKKNDGGRIERKIEDFRKLIHIVNISKTEYSREDIELSKKEETVVVLSPIFRRQIDSKFILYPNDINRRTAIAYGSSNISESALRLRDYLMRELSSKRFEPEMSLDKLYYLLAEKWMRESRKKKVKQFTDKAIETAKALELLLKHEIVPDVNGESKIVFYLNKKWE